MIYTKINHDDNRGSTVYVFECPQGGEGLTVVPFIFLFKEVSTSSSRQHGGQYTFEKNNLSFVLIHYTKYLGPCLLEEVLGQ